MTDDVEDVPPTNTTRPMTIREVLDKLGEMPRDHMIPGLDPDGDTASYRGYYERLAIEPGLGVKAGVLFDALARRLGTHMTGYKGGQFEIHGDTLVHIAGWSDLGPMLVDIVHGPGGGLLVTEEETW